VSGTDGVEEGRGARVAATPNDQDRTSGYSMRGQQGRVIDGVGRDIVSGRFPIGELVSKEADLSAAYGVSRTSVREAMRVLAAKGLVDIRQKVGTKVRQREQWNVFDGDILRWHSEEGLGESILRDLVEIRQILEPQAARLAAGRAQMDDLHRLHEVVAAMTEAIGDPHAYAITDVDFHMAVYAASHNVLLRQFGAVVADYLRLSFELQQQVDASEPVLAEDVERHADVLRAIDRGEGERAAERMLDVVLDGKSALARALGGQQSASA
jgi:GntR family galactonate operon transcriptional repressor